MARESTLVVEQPNHVANAQVHIAHPQLRDLVICPQERGIVNYLSDSEIIEHDITDPDAITRQIAKLSFEANTLGAYALPDTDDYLLAAGGQYGELHLSLHSRLARTRRSASGSMSDITASAFSLTPAMRRRLGAASTRRVWTYESTLPGTINNSVLFTTLAIARAGVSSVEPRLIVSNNNQTVTFYDISTRALAEGTPEPGAAPERLVECGALTLDVPINHSTVSPNGQTLLSVGDSAHVHLHHISPTAHLTFTRALTLTMPKPADLAPYLSYPLGSNPASFSTAFSASGTKFAVGAQNGVVAIWDVRSSKPMRIFRTDRTPAGGDGGGGTGAASGWLRSLEWESTPHIWPAGGVRCLKFGGGGVSGREVLAFTEHTGRIHIVDARTFETEEIIRMPAPRPRVRMPTSSESSSRARSASPPTRDGLTFARSADRESGGAWPARYPNPWREDADADAPEPDGATGTTLTDDEGDSARAHAGGTPPDEILIPAVEHALAEEDVRQILAGHGVLPRAPDTLTPFVAGYPYPTPAFLQHVGGVLRLPSPPSPPAPPRGETSRAGRRRKETEYGWDDDVDIAGLCFDPRGARMYVASTRAVGEWDVRGAEKQWWVDGSWA